MQRANSFSSLLDGVRFLATKLQTVQQDPPLWLYGAYATLVLPIQLVLYGCVRLAAILSNPLTVPAKTRYGFEMLCHLPDAIQTCIFLYGVWEPDISAFILSALQQGDTFIDVGAHVGYHAILASHSVGGAGQVVALEASPGTFRLLEANLLLNPDCQNVRALNVAAAEQTGTIPFYLGPEGVEGWSTTVMRKASWKQTTIAAAPLSSLLAEQELQSVRLIKIDVEGAEAEVIRGLLPVLSLLRSDVELIVELTPHLWPAVERERYPIFEQVLTPLFDAGFHPYHIQNTYAPWRFLYPERITRPQRIREPMQVSPISGQVEVVLSRKDVDRL